MGTDTGELERIWHEHTYPTHLVFVDRWEQEPGIYFRLLQDGDTLLVQGLCLLSQTTRGGQSRIELRGARPDSQIASRAVREVVAMIVSKFKEKAAQDGN